MTSRPPPTSRRPETASSPAETFRWTTFGHALLGARTRAAQRALYAPNRSLTYIPRKNQPGTPAATASAQGVLDRMLKDLGLFHADVTASSITLWRIQAVFAARGEDHATEFSGRSSNEQLKAILFCAAPHVTENTDEAPITGFLAA